jgi:N-acetylneuraminic acid mutarotase
MDNSFTITPGGNVWTTTVQPPETGTIPRGGQIPVTVSVQIPPNAPIGSQDVATITVSSELPTRGAFTATAVLTSSVTSYGVDFNPQGMTRAGRYGAPVTYTVQLTNRSGITNTFELSHTDSEWPTSITPSQTGNVAPDASVPITITVSVPANATLGMRDTVAITAEGQEPEPGQFFGVTVITTTAGLWERKANMPVPRSRGAAVTLPSNGRIYLVGGENNNGNTDLPIKEYDPIGNRWARRASLSIGVSNVGAAVIGDAIYVPGGYSGPSGRAQTALQVYYPLENRVNVVASDPLPQPRLGSGVTEHNGKLYVIGGSDDTLVGTNTVYQYDPSRPAGSRWQQMAPMPTRRLYLAAATVDSLIYAVGGLSGQLTDLATLEVFDPASNTWATRRPMRVPRAGLAAVGVSSGEPGCGGYLYAIGGGWSDYTASAERYDMTRDAWEPVSGLTLARRSLAAAYSPSTRALVALGGWTGRYESIAEAVQCSGGFTPPTPVPTPTCAVNFSDVPANHTFYPFVRCLACLGIVSGYADGTFKPDNLVTRGQLAKIVSNAAAFADNPDPQIYQDVSSTNPFYEWINRLSRRGYMGGYTCGGPGEPCVGNRPYFRPFANATRAQTSKIVSNAARYNDPPTGQTFEDVPSSHPFYVEIQRLASRGIMGGYECGGPGEPCVSGKPYFRPYNDVTRGQSAKIVANTFYPDCQAR